MYREGVTIIMIVFSSGLNTLMNHEYVLVKPLILM